MLDYTADQTDRARDALDAYALSQGVTRRDLNESASQFGGGGALVEHVRRVERQTGLEYQSIPVHVRGLLSDCRIVAATLAHTCPPHEWPALDRHVWSVATAAMS